MIGDLVVLVHGGTRETRSVPIEYICRTYLSVRWGMSGIYDLNLRDNVLTARSAKSRNKGGSAMKWWRAEGITGIRERVRIFCDGEDKRESIRRMSEQHERRKADEAAEWAARDARAVGMRAKRIDE